MVFELLLCCRGAKVSQCKYRKNIFSHTYTSIHVRFHIVLMNELRMRFHIILALEFVHFGIKSQTTAKNI